MRRCRNYFYLWDNICVVCTYLSVYVCKCKTTTSFLVKISFNVMVKLCFDGRQICERHYFLIWKWKKARMGAPLCMERSRTFPRSDDTLWNLGLEMLNWLQRSWRDLKYAGYVLPARLIFVQKFHRRGFIVSECASLYFSFISWFIIFAVNGKIFNSLDCKNRIF